jgi:hypothetical protein
MSTIRRLRRASLRPRETLVLKDAQGTSIFVERGCLWVTLENDPRDVVLAKGTRFVVDRPGRTIVAAETDSALRLLVPVHLRDRIVASLARAGAKLLRGWTGRPPPRVAPHF